MLGRVIALLVMVGSAGMLAYYHRADLMPAPEVPLDPAEAAFSACLKDRAEGIETMRGDGTISEQQAALFLSRAEALCRATAAPGQ
ncbi:MAG: hypothetical protein R8L07_11850 [Alphaproteobacteria bacterium]|nr:hypothetical protein [Alphaproteobacteria bacterium]